jgi:hypothetical protein
VTVSQGVYNVVLGASDLLPNPIALPFDQQYYLGVKVGSDPEMTPRIPLTSVGYAFRAQTVESVGSHTHSGADITTGTVLEPRIDSAIARTSALNAHTSNMNNPHATTATQVGAAPSVHSHSGGDITTGIVAEARIDPLIARDSEVTATVNAHASRTDNPHSTTAAQVGAVALNQTNSITSAMIVDGTIAPADVGFSYAASTTKGGAATDLNCTGCVSSGNLADGAVTRGKLNATGGGTGGQVLGTDGATLTWLSLGVQRAVYGTVNGSYSNQDMGIVSGTGFSIEPAVVDISYVGVKITFIQPFPNTPTCVVTPFQTHNHARPCSYWHPDDYFPGMQLNYFLLLCRPEGASDAAAMVPFSFICVF